MEGGKKGFKLWMRGYIDGCLSGEWMDLSDGWMDVQGMGWMDGIDVLLGRKWID